MRLTPAHLVRGAFAYPSLLRRNDSHQSEFVWLNIDVGVVFVYLKTA